VHLPQGAEQALAAGHVKCVGRQRLLQLLRCGRLLRRRLLQLRLLQLRLLQCTHLRLLLQRSDLLLLQQCRRQVGVAGKLRKLAAWHAAAAGLTRERCRQLRVQPHMRLRSRAFTLPIRAVINQLIFPCRNDSPPAAGPAPPAQGFRVFQLWTLQYRLDTHSTSIHACRVGMHQCAMRQSLIPTRIAQSLQAVTLTTRMAGSSCEA